MGKEAKQEVWVCGVAYAPAWHVRKVNKQRENERRIIFVPHRVERRGCGHGVVCKLFRGCTGSCHCYHELFTRKTSKREKYM